MKRGLRTFGSLLMILLCLIWLSPIYIVFVNSFKNRAEMYQNILAFPEMWSFQYYVKAMKKMQLQSAFRNSLLVTTGSIFCIVILASMTAWMITRRRNRMSKFLYAVFVATMLIPFQTVMMPLLQELAFFRDHLGINMLDHLWGLGFTYIGFGASMAVFLYSGFVNTIPVSLEEAATIDGATTLRVFWSVVFPLLKPTTMTVIVLDVIWIWNDYLLPSLILSSKAKRTVPLSTAYFFGQFTIQWNMAMAGLMMTIIPVILFYIFAQKYIVKGVAAGAVKG